MFAEAADSGSVVKIQSVRDTLWQALATRSHKCSVAGLKSAF
jgi:hypothetical protein